MHAPRWFLAFLLIGCPALRAVDLFAPSGDDLVEASLVADTSAVVPGQPFRVGLRLKMKEGWHTYAGDPGDSGLPTSVTWKLPPGFSAGAIRWPQHSVHVDAGNLRTNVYYGEVVLTVPMRAPARIDGTAVRLEGVVEWLACEKICLPGKASVSLELPVASRGEPANAALFARYPEAGAGGAAAEGGGSLWTHLLFGFIGGLLLNVMPCVLPVIALKIMGFVHQAGKSRARVFALGLAFAAGVFAWFLGLAALIVGVKSVGHEVSWAFQFQNPWFVGGMLAVILGFALNLLGAFEVLLPSGVNGAVARWASSDGLGGAFLHGLFATLLATPCTAPFLGPALGFALSQPPGVIAAVFASVAAGMSAPYLLLTAQPAWMRFLPKPGPWMVRLKQVLGVLLLGSAVWLGWVLWKQVAPRPAEEAFGVRLERALGTGRIVFVDFTADWCVNCKVNERLVLRSEEVQRAFRERGVEFLVADWTRGDAEIGEKIRSFGRAGVPLYVVYPPGGGKPRVLPEILTPGIVTRTLNEIAPAGD